MKGAHVRLLSLIAAAALTAPIADGQSTSGSPSSEAGAAWQADLAAATAEARLQGRPILVRAGATWCGWCKRLEGELDKPEVQKELRQWTLVYLDVDRSRKEARDLGIGPVPALRALTSTGRLAASHDGYLPADELAVWLAKSREEAVQAPADLGNPTAAPAAPSVERLIQELDRRDPAAREAAIRRLITFPSATAAPVVEAFVRGGLATRLAALEILQEWQAPMRDIDPWRPETITEERLTALKEWAAQADRIATNRPTELTAEQIGLARREIDRLLDEEGSPAEAEAIRERLARYGPLLLPEVYERLKQAVTDRVRERLTALRYRLVATDELAFTWAGGLERLASMDVPTRHAAAEELARRATAADGPLLLELFSDPDSLVREISLRALQQTGGAKETGALARLLDDPEPNVRAAVLKQLAESPSREMVPRIAEYVAKEGDADLVVHAVRVLRATKGSESMEVLLSLLSYNSWRVRAETAEAISEMLTDSGSVTSKVRAKAQEALLGLLKDTDGFVVSQAVKGLRDADLAKAVEPMVEAAEQHPELAADVLGLLAESSNMRAKAVPHLRKFCSHANASVRVAAITGLCAAVPHGVEAEMLATLGDDNSRVRIAAATALFKILESSRPRKDDDVQVHIQSVPERGNLVTRFLSGFRAKETVVVTTTRPVAEQPQAGGDGKPSKSDEWLVKFRAGEGRLPWLAKTIEPLEVMLTASDLQERLAAAIALVPLGRDEKALPVLLAAVGQNTTFVGQAAAVLPWLPWEQRLDMFDSLIGMHAGAGAMTQLAQAMAVWPDLRATEPLWAQLADEQATADVAASVLEGLRKLYFGDYSHSPSRAPKAQRTRASEDARSRTRSGPELQRTVALVLLMAVSLKDAADEAAAIVADPAVSETLRRDAFQVRLLCQGKGDGEKMAAEALSAESPAIRRMALTYLAQGAQNLHSVRDGRFFLYYENPSVERYMSFQSGQPIKVDAPSGLQAEVVRPLLADPDPQIAAYAGYLLAVLGDASGLDPLIRYWRDHAKDDHAWKRLVFRAVTALDDDARLPLIEEIYRTYSREDYWLREFYWTIRSMKGPNVTEFRKVIRSEVGMDNLR